VNTPFTVAVLAPDGVTPVSGASVQFSSSPAVAFSACGGASSCTLLSDESGTVSTLVALLSAGVTILTAQLAPASYAQPQQVQTTVLGVSSNLDLCLPTPSVWIAQGAALSVPLIASQPTGASDINGLASFPVAPGGFSGNIAVIGSATAGSAGLQFAAQQLGPGGRRSRAYKHALISASLNVWSEPFARR
jgi:hypothetical protein